MNAALNYADVQGFILRGYHMKCVQHFLLKVVHPEAARAFLGSLVDNQATGTFPHITSAAPWGDQKPSYCLNVGLTYNGLKALGLPQTSIDSFASSKAFVEGAVARAEQVGDTGANAPENWDIHIKCPDVHVLLSLYTTGETLADAQAALNDHTVRFFELFATTQEGQTATLDAAPQPFLRCIKSYGGQLLGGEGGGYEHVHFGFRDGISQPLIEGTPQAETRSHKAGVPLPPGAVLLGHPSPWKDYYYPQPQPSVLGVNGSFVSFRILEQDVKGFQDYVQQAAHKHKMEKCLTTFDDRGLSQELDDWSHGPLPEDLSKQLAYRGHIVSTSARLHTEASGAQWRLYDQGRMCVIRKEGEKLSVYSGEPIAAKICGRQFDGTPLTPKFDSQPKTTQDVHAQDLNDFDYLDDPYGYSCPFGAHTRRTNPRKDRIAGNTSEEPKDRGQAANQRRIVRRGMPYGPEYKGIVDGKKRGLLGLFICASLEDQFEFLMKRWVNAGGFTGPLPSNSKDPLIGTQDGTSILTIPQEKQDVHLKEIPQFVTTRGGLYCFLPSLSALKYISSLGPSH